MESKIYHCLGVMSGTSLDGIDLAETFLKYEENNWSFQIGLAETVPYNSHWKKVLKEIDTYSKRKVANLDETYTVYLAKKIKAFIEKHQLKNLDAVCSHGHTVFHEPEHQYTLQIGNLSQLATLIEQTLVCNFRVEDVALGGQGAPLVPIGDRLLFSSYTACLNLGGFANISMEINDQRIAYDIGAVNTVLNHYAQKCGKSFDKNGELAKTGTVNTALLQQLSQLPFYQLKPPKSLGIEWVKAQIFPLLENSEDKPKNLLATYTLHIAQILAKEFSNLQEGTILITGGGAYNRFLIEKTQELTKHKLVIPGQALVEYKEALIFALLGVLKLRGEINVLKSVTGAARDHSSGFIYTP